MAGMVSVIAYGEGFMPSGNGVERCPYKGENSCISKSGSSACGNFRNLNRAKTAVFCAMAKVKGAKK